MERPEARLARLYSLNPHEEYLEFVHEDERILVDVRSLEAIDREAVLTDAAARSAAEARPAELASQIEACWAAISGGAPAGIDAEEVARTHTTVYITHWKLVPPLLWTLNCATTSKAMVIGYWDHYVKGVGTIKGFGRLIDYWYEHPSNGQNVPNLLDECHAVNNINLWAVNGYSCQWTEIKANAGNDWAWSDYKGEIDAGHPAPWSYAGHTMAGIGYRTEPWGRWAVVYNTYNKQPAEYVYSTCVGIARIIPGSGTGAEHAVLDRPYGGESIYGSVPAEISWFVYGSKIDKADLFVSTDAGSNWAGLGSGIPAQQGWNSYLWLPGQATAKGRVRLKAYAGSQYIAGDGSEENVTVQPQGAGQSWKQVGGPAQIVVAGYDKQKAARLIFTTDPATGDLYQFWGKPGAVWNWIQVGGPGKMFVLDAQGKLYGLSPDGGSVWQYLGEAMKWKQIGGPAKAIYGDVDGVLATNPDSGDLYRYQGVPFAWIKIGGPGKAFGTDAKGSVYGLAPDGGSVWRYDGLFGPPVPWIKIGGAATNLYARGLGVYTTEPGSGNVHFFHGKLFRWTQIGGPGKIFSVDTEGRLYGLAPDQSGVYRYEGSYSKPNQWAKIGGPATMICAGWREVLAINPQTKDLWIYA